MKLDWHEASTPPGSWAASLHGVNLFTAKRHNKGYRLHTKLKGIGRGGKIRFCHNLKEAQEVAAKVLTEYLRDNDEIELHQRKRKGQ